MLAAPLPRSKVIAAAEPPPYGRLARISRPKLAGGGRHEGVLLPSGLAVHTSAVAGGIEVCSFERFRAGHEVQVEFELPPHAHAVALRKINALIAANAPYDALQNNCEMFARAAVLEEPWSPQVGFWLVVGIVASVFLFRGSAAIR